MNNEVSISALNKVMRAIASIMQSPVIVLLIILIAVAVFLIGWIVSEYFTEHRHLKVVMPAMVDAVNESDDVAATIEESKLLKSQKEALIELTKHKDLTPLMRESLAVRLLTGERERYNKILRISDLVAKLGPILGLLGTLIPLGPGIIALGQGDTITLSASMLTAFDTTILGMIAAAVAMVVSNIRNSWYDHYMSVLETLMECVLEVENK